MNITFRPYFSAPGITAPMMTAPMVSLPGGADSFVAGQNIGLNRLVAHRSDGGVTTETASKSIHYLYGVMNSVCAEYGFLDTALVLEPGFHTNNGAEKAHADWLKIAATADNISQEVRDGLLSSAELFDKGDSCSATRSMVESLMKRLGVAGDIPKDRTKGNILICSRKRNSVGGENPRNDHLKARVLPYERRKCGLVPLVPVEKMMDSSVKMDFFKSEIERIAELFGNESAYNAIRWAMKEDEIKRNCQFRNETLEAKTKALAFKYMAVALLYPHVPDAERFAGFLQNVIERMERALKGLDDRHKRDRAFFIFHVNLAACDINIAVSAFLRNEAANRAFLVQRTIEITMMSTDCGRRELLMKIAAKVNKQVAKKLLAGEKPKKEMIDWFDMVAVRLDKLDELSAGELQGIYNSYLAIAEDEARTASTSVLT